MYYSIGEVADMFNVAPSLIRFWESEFDLIAPKRNRGGLRRYVKEDIDRLREVYDLVKVQGYTLAGAKKALKEARDRSETNPTPEQVADRIVNMMKKAGLTPGQMLRVIRRAKQILHRLKYEREMEVSHD